MTSYTYDLGVRVAVEAQDELEACHIVNGWIRSVTALVPGCYCNVYPLLAYSEILA